MILLSIMNTLIIFSAKYLYLFVIAIAVVLFWRLKEYRKEMVLFVIISFPLMYLVRLFAGSLYFNPRPFVVEHFIPLISHSADNGFPSDHTLLVSAFAMLFFYYRRRVSFVMWILAFAVGAARVAAGVHHSLDIVGSMLIAICVAWFTHAYLLPLAKRTKAYQSR